MTKQNAMPYRRYAKHTPSPWRYTDGGIICTCGASWHDIADVCGADIHDNRGPAFDEACANAYLIAAAPELLAALERLVAEYGENHPLKQWQEARIAINKAKGGGNSLASPSESEE